MLPLHTGCELDDTSYDLSNQLPLDFRDVMGRYWGMPDMEILITGVKKMGLPLSQRQLEQFGSYYQELVNWNRRVNLTSVIDCEGVQVKHFLDSLTVMPLLEKGKGHKNIRVIDVGAGAGFPGLPLKILSPQVDLVLLEATAKKTEFLQHIVRKLELEGVEIVNGRAESIARENQYREKFDIVLSRAVAPLPILVELTLPFCALGGSFIAQKKGDIDAEVSSAERAISLLGGSLREVRKIELEELNDERFLVIIDKVAPAPPQYPRRPGIPARRPLRG